MLKYAFIINKKTKQVAVCDESQIEHFKDCGYTEQEVEQSYEGLWYIAGYAPKKPAPTYEEQKEARAIAYRLEKDPITCQIQSLRDEEQTEEIIAEIEELKIKRVEVVQEIKERYPYPEEVQDEEQAES